MGRRIRSRQERLTRWEVSGSQTRQDRSLKWRQWWWREAVTGTIGPGGGGARLAAGSPEAGEGKMKGRIPGPLLLEHREWCACECLWYGSVLKLLLLTKLLITMPCFLYLVCYNNVSDL